MKEVIKPYLESGRAGDWEHAVRVVKWVKEIGQNRADIYLLITAAYIHDIGWFGVAPKGKINLDEMKRLEPRANENSAKLIPSLLKEIGFDNFEISTIVRLVAAADKHFSVEGDEAIIVDADNLSKLCIEHLEQKYQRESFPEVIKLWEVEFPNRIKTKKGLDLFPKLLSDLKSKVLG